MWKINVKDIIKEKRKIIEETYTIDEIELHTGTYKVLDDGFKVKMIVTYADNKILLGGYARGYVERPCDRCLKLSKCTLTEPSKRCILLRRNIREKARNSKTYQMKF